jgi:23S rRNA (cytosine1962-C5)-methyltransferase
VPPDSTAAVISRKGVERVHSGHPWIYRSDVTREPNLPAGGETRVLDQRGHFVALAHYSPRSKIALRLLSQEDQPLGRMFYGARLGRALELRERLFPGVDGLRLVNGEADLLPGLTVDRYGDVVVLQTLTPTMEALKPMWVELLAERLSPKTIVERNDVRAREHEALPLVKGVLLGETPAPVEYHEGSVSLIADTLDGQKTGAFLDQRENHLAAASYARGECLDAFSYHGGFALQMWPRADKVTAVEMSDHAATLLRQGLTRNAAERVEVVEKNAFDFLREELDRGARYDTIVLDPPAFAKTKDRVEAALRGYKEINLRALQLLREGGVLITCSCSYHVSSDLFEEMLRGAASDARRPVQILERRGAGRDHPSLLGAPETRYLKVLIARTPA